MNNKLDYIAIDFETANQYRNSACSVGLVRFIDGKESDSCNNENVLWNKCKPLLWESQKCLFTNESV